MSFLPSEYIQIFYDKLIKMSEDNNFQMIKYCKDYIKLYQEKCIHNYN